MILFNGHVKIFGVGIVFISTGGNGSKYNVKHDHNTILDHVCAHIEHGVRLSQCLNSNRYHGKI